MTDPEKKVRPSKPEEITVFQARKGSKCAECGEKLAGGEMITLRGEGDQREVLCIDCSDLGHLEFLGRGNAALTRRAGKYTGLRAIVVEWSRSRKRFERQGILAEPSAIEQAEEECLADADLREHRKERRREREDLLDAKFVERFAEAIRVEYPSCPPEAAAKIATHACRKHSGRVGRSAGAKEFEPKAITLAVRAHLRHRHTKYDSLLMAGWNRNDARSAIAPDLNQAERKWQG